jgi:N-acylmannosamine kinase
MNQTLTLDVGGTHSRAALFEDGHIVWRHSVPTPGQQGPDAMVSTLLGLIAPVPTTDARIGVAIAGQVHDGGHVTAHNSALLRGWTAFPLEQALSQKLQRPVRVFNDARAAAWAEYRFGAGRGCSDFLFVTVSTGVGAGLVLKGRLHLARNGFDAELGETLASDGQSLEAHASGTALAQLAAQHGSASGRALCDAADAGDTTAERLLTHGIHELALKLADLTVMLGIERSAVGGGLGLRPGYLERLRQEMHRLPALHRHEIIAAELGATQVCTGWRRWHGNPQSKIHRKPLAVARGIARAHAGLVRLHHRRLALVRRPA